MGREVKSLGMVVGILPTRGCLAMSGDIFDCQNWDEGHYWHLVGARDAAKRHTKL